jgi:hypothetical protein
MSDKLYEMLRIKFPPVGPYKIERVTTYPPDCDRCIERIHLNLIDEAFFGLKEPILESASIEKLAKKTFDIPFRFYTQQEEGDVILFSPEGIDEYIQKYAGHSIEVLQKPPRSPIITFSTGNRGCIGLHNRQRKKYFNFAVNLNDLFLECVNKK